MDNQYLAPAVVVALTGIIIQGIKAILDLIDRAAARKMNERQRRISLSVALIRMIDATSLPEGEKVVNQHKIMQDLLSDMLTEDINKMFGFDNEEN